MITSTHARVYRDNGPASVIPERPERSSRAAQRMKKEASFRRPPKDVQSLKINGYWLRRR